MLWTRVASAAVLAPLFLWIVWTGGILFSVLIAVIAGVMAVEFTRMDGKAGLKRRTLIAVAAVAAVALMAADHAAPAVAVIVAATAALIVADQVAGRKGLYVIQIAVLYVALPAVSLLYVMA